MTDAPRTMGLIRSLAKRYIRNSPLRKGSYRLADLAINLGGALPEEVIAETVDGREILLNPSDYAYKYSYFFGEYEPAITQQIRKHVKPGMTAFDLGANLGWYTTMIAELVGDSGFVHGFEPTPRTFSRLKQNIELNGLNQRVRINQLALGDSEGPVSMSLEDGMPDGHAAVSNESDGYQVEQITLDRYLSEQKIESVDFLKVDIEGSELGMFKGAERLFNQEKLPIMVVEMALDTTVSFGYTPKELIEYLDSRAKYEYFCISETQNALIPIMGFDEKDKGANVLCLPTS